MNIFAVHSDPSKAAQMLCDRHVVKMTLETTQILSTVHRVIDGDADYQLPDERNEYLYKVTHVKHPCVQWASTNQANYQWLAQHGIALAYEYFHRYDKFHACHEKLVWLQDNMPHNLLDGELTPFVLAMPDDMKCSHPVLSYRRYYLHHKAKIAKWKHNNTPIWFIRKDIHYGIEQ